MSVPNYMLDKNAVLSDEGVEWRDGKPPNYEKANALYEAGTRSYFILESKERTTNHEAGSLENLVENLVKNWEKEASYKIRPEDWRTIDHKVYQFSTNGGRWSDSEEMIKIGTYNALIGESQYYSSKNAGRDESHLTFKQSLRSGFAWETIKVYSAPPIVAFKWRHWGKFTGKLRCPLANGDRLEADPSGKVVEIFGVTIAKVSDSYQVQSLETYYDPAALFNQMVGDSPNVSYAKCPVTGQTVEEAAGESSNV